MSEKKTIQRRKVQHPRPKPGVAAVQLRRHAEKRLNALAPETQPTRAEDESRRQLHELQVHQIELEMQNEELRHIREALESALNKYSELYDFAPVGYFTIDADGLIVEANLKAAHLMGIERGLLLKRPFAGFVAEAVDRKVFSRHLDSVFQRKGSQTCDIRLKRKYGAAFHAQLQSIAKGDIDGKAGGILTAVIDITERKKAEAKIEHLASFPQLNPNPVIETDLEGRVIFYNAATDSVFQKLGVKVDVRLFLPPDMTGIIQALKQKNEGEYVITEVGLHGRVFTENITHHPQMNVVRIYAQDITERKRAEALLHLNEERHRTILQTALNGYWLADAQGRLLEVNKTYCRMSGYSAQELLTMRVTDLESIATATETAAHMQKIIAVGEDRFASQHRRKDGSVFDVEVSVQYRPYEGGQFVCFLQDITDRKQAERRQSLSAEILAIVNDALPLAEAINRILAAIKRETRFDAVGIRLRRGDDFPYFNSDGFSQDFLLTENTLITRDPSGGICRDENGNVSLECTCGVVISGRTDPTNPLFTKGGSFWINDSLPLLDLPADEDPRLNPRNRCIHEGFRSVAIVPIRANKEIVGLLQLNDRGKDRFNPDMIAFFEGLASSIGIALTRKWSEEAIRERTAQLEFANKELESFSYSVSHDLHAPLRAIDGYSRMILRQQGDKFDENTRRQFEVIRQNVKTMGQLIDDLLALSRLGRETMNLSRLNMKDLVRDVWEGLKALNPDRRIDLNLCHNPPGMGDRSLIKQVLVNILSNAIKYTRNRDVAHIEVGGYATESENVYYVKDNGVGFDMRYHDKLFAVFQRLHSAEEYEGTGVGLAIVQRIVHRHGGRVWAESEPDKGATFYFTLPVAEE
jgi:PAS domain S-box-containing protein